MSEKPYLADVQVGDKLYNFLEDNKEYVVIEVVDEKILTTCPIIVKPANGRDDVKIKVSYFGTEVITQDIPYYLYAPVDVLDPKNLPPRPWRPKKGEWVWCRCPGDIAWNLRKFICKEGNRYLLERASGVGTISYDEIAPFKGELPPGLEEEENNGTC